ncbi:MAG: globin [Crocinitomicaceae bacterium]
MIANLYIEIGPIRLRELVNRFYDEVFSNDKIGFLFANSSRETIEEKQYLFLSQFLGGPNLYSEQYGHPKMRMRHLPHAITEEAKNEWLNCMHRSIQALDMDEELKIRLYQVFPNLAAHMVNR